MNRLKPLLDRIIFYYFLFLLAFIPLYPKIPLYNEFPFLKIPNTFVAIRLEDFFIAFFVIIFAFYLIISGKIRDLIRDKLMQTFMLFFFVGFVSTFSAIFVTHTVYLNLGIFNYLRRFEYMVFLPAAYIVIKDKKRLRICIFVLGAVIFLVDIYALLQQYFNFPLISTTNSEFSKGQILYISQPAAHVNSSFAGYYDLAIFLAMTLSVSAAYILKPMSIFLRAWIGFIGLLSFFVLVLTAARLSFAAAILGILSSVFLVGKKWMIVGILIVAILAVAYPSQLRSRLISTITVNILNQGARYDQNSNLVHQLNIPTLPIHESTAAASHSGVFSSTRSGVPADIAPGEPINTTALGVYRSFEIRLNVEWPRAIRALIKNPLLGTGYSSLGLATDSDVLRSFGETGILGTLAFILVIVQLFKMVWRNFHSSDKLIRFFSAGVLSMVFAFIVNGLFIDVFEASKVATLFWMVVGMGLNIPKTE